MKDAIAIIHERTSINHFDPTKSISEAEIKQLVADATEAPSSFNIQHWRFIAVTDGEGKKQLQAAAYNQAKVGQASATIIVLGDLRGYEKIESILQRNPATKNNASMTAQRAAQPYVNNPQFQRDEAIRSGALAAMTFMIAAQARGYVTGPMIGFDPEQVKRTFNISDRYVPVMLITLGFPAPGNMPRKPRLGADEVLAFNRGREF